MVTAHITGGTARSALGDIAVDARGPQGDARLLIRPEQIRLLTSGSGVSARVAEVSFYGHDAAIQLELVPTGERVVARVFGREVPAAGADVRVTVDGPVTVFDPVFLDGATASADLY
jgi:iron(III) transport system ATP-binding protein